MLLLLVVMILFILRDGLFHVDHVVAEGLLLLGRGGGVAALDRLESDEDESAPRALGAVFRAVHRLDFAELLEMRPDLLLGHLRIHAADEDLLDFLREKREENIRT